MYDTARRVALVKQRVRENTRRRQRREAISLSAFCLMLFTALAGAADALIVRGQTAAWGAFGAMLEDGSIDGLPERLSEANIEFEFETPLSDALRKLKAAQFDQLMGRVGILLQSQHPEAMGAIDNVDFDQALRDAMDGLAPAKWQKTKEDVEAIRAGKAEAAQAAKQEAMAMEVGQSAMKANPDSLRMVGDALSAGLEQI